MSGTVARESDRLSATKTVAIVWGIGVVLTVFMVEVLVVLSGGEIGDEIGGRLATSILSLILGCCGAVTYRRFNGRNGRAECLEIAGVPWARAWLFINALWLGWTYGTCGLMSVSGIAPWWIDTLAWGFLIAICHVIMWSEPWRAWVDPLDRMRWGTYPIATRRQAAAAIAQFVAFETVFNVAVILVVAVLIRWFRG